MESWGSDPSIGFVSTYPPTVCGLASFSASLLGAIAENRGSREGLGVVGLADSSSGLRSGMWCTGTNGETRSLSKLPSSI